MQNAKQTRFIFFLSSHDGFSLKGPNQDTGSSEQQEQSVTLTQKLTSWYKTEAVEQPQGGWRIKEQTGKEYRVTEKQSENWLDAGKTNEDGARNHKERKTQAKKRGKNAQRKSLPKNRKQI